VSDTIFALATAPGRAPVAIIRLSGPRAREALITVGGGKPAHSQARVRRLRSTDGRPLDTAVTLFFAGPHSYTGEDCAELHLHGGAGVVDGVTETLLSLGLRLAEAGEFTRRAFENGKLDLDQAEAIADLTDAETTAQARQALGQLEGRLGARYRTWRETLVDALARLEAAVDFPDEDVPVDVAQQARAALQGLASDLDSALADEGRGRRVREGYRVAIIGAPNSGKSSLLNHLNRRDAAIVTPTPGATRDIIETSLILDGFKVVLADMAGIRRTSDPIESEGVRRARAWAEGADFRLWVVDRAEQTGLWREAFGLVRSGDICILNKSDQAAGRDEIAARRGARTRGADVISLSLLNDGASTVEAALSVRVRQDLAGAEFPAATRARHEALLREARDHLERALSQLDEPELAADDARLAARSLERISGRIGADEILGRVFATFCIGK
jgi:tRNA modification GTPase